MSNQQTAVAVFGGGCFWCTEAIFDELRGVKSVISGYAGGTTKNPSYEQVCSGRTGHAEAIKIEFDPAEISFRDLMTVFFATHDPTTLNRQGNDVGTQYRSAIYTFSRQQHAAAEATREAYQRQLDAAGLGKITTEIFEAPPFYFAEDYHQQYLAKNPHGYCGLGGTGVTCPVPAKIAAA